MHRSPRNAVVAFVVFVVALGGAIMLLQNSSPDSKDTGGDGGGSRQVASSTIWKTGTSWTVSVRQDSGAITPDGATSVATIPFRFEVTDAPTSKGGVWKVHVEQEGAEGPFAAGWNLQYKETDGVMTLHRVAVGDQPPLEAEIATIVLGPQFPYEVTYKAAPKSYTVDADKLIDRSLTPPSALPGNSKTPSGVTPPAQAPKLTAGGAPDEPAR